MAGLVLGLVATLRAAAPGPAWAAPASCFPQPGPGCVTTAPLPLPASEAELRAAQAAVAAEPEGAAALFLASLVTALADEELGRRLLPLTLAPGAEAALLGPSGVVPFLLRQRPRCVRSFAAGSSPVGGYDLDPGALRFRLRRDGLAGGEARLFVCSSGLGNCQPMTLRRDGAGPWRVQRFSSIGCADEGDGRFPPAPAAPPFLGRRDLGPDDKIALQLELGRICGAAPPEGAACVQRLHRALGALGAMAAGGADATNAAGSPRAAATGAADAPSAAPPGASGAAPLSAAEAPRLLEATVALGRTLGLRGGDRAAPLLRAALSQAEALPAGPPRARALLQIAAAQIELGSPYAAEALVARAAPSLKVAEASPELAALGRLQLALGASAAAEETLRRLAALREARAAAEPLPLAEALTLLGGVQAARGRLDAARDTLRRALSLSAGAAPAALAQLHLALGRALTGLGRAAEAEAALLRAADLLRGARAPLGLAEVLGALGDLRRTMGSLSPAARWLREALALEEGTLGPDHPRSARRRRELAAVLLATEDQAVARSRLPPGALLPASVGTFGKALELLRASLGAGERQLRLVGAGLSERALGRLLLDLREEEELLYSIVQRRPEQPAALRLALAAALLRKGRSLDEAARSSQAAYRGLGEAERGRMDELRLLRGRLARLALAGPGGGDPAAYRERVAALEQRADALEAELSLRSAPLRARRALPGPEAVVDEVARALPAGAALVELVAYRPEDLAAEGAAPRKGPPRYLAMVLLGDDRLRAADLGAAAPIDAAAERLLGGLRRDGGDYQGAAEELRRLLRPALAMDGVGPRLVLSPDGPLSLVPFEVLSEGGRALLDDHEISYVTSGRDLLRPASDAPAREVVVLADAAFYGAGAPSTGGAAAGPTTTAPAAAATPLAPSAATPLAPSTLVRERGLKLGRLAPLPGTREEALALRALWPAARLLLGAEATEPALLGLRGPGVLHVATHGLFVAEAGAEPERARGFSVVEAPPPPSPMLRSALVLAGAGAAQGEAAADGADGLATALEVSAMDLWGTQLVTLSACDTGRGEALPGRGVYGLRRALVAAGAEGLVTSLWKVNDAVTRDLMTAFYRGLLGGAARPAALRQAAQEIRRQHPHPYYWAPFLYLGQPGPLRGLAPPAP